MAQAELYPCSVLLLEGRAREASLVGGAEHGPGQELAPLRQEVQADAGLPSTLLQVPATELPARAGRADPLRLSA